MICFNIVLMRRCFKLLVSQTGVLYIRFWHQSQNLLVIRVSVWTVRWPQIWRDKIRCFLLKELGCFTSIEWHQTSWYHVKRNGHGIMWFSPPGSPLTLEFPHLTKSHVSLCPYHPCLLCRGRWHQYAIFSSDAHEGKLLLAADQTSLMLSTIC